MPPLEIVHETKDYIVINKMAGVISERNPFEHITAEDQVLTHLKIAKRDPYLGVIHRLDRVTSGVMIFAKKKSVLVAFNRLFSDRKVQKTYLAVVKNKPAQEKEKLHHFLLKNKQNKRAEIFETETSGAKEAILSYEIIAENSFGYLLKIKPKTGRFHQIRAQLAYIGSPIIGDNKYGSDQEHFPLTICLHAWQLSCPIAENQKIQTFQAPLPKNDVWTFESITT